jgi:8-oxo-dGTP pyrophosphatase MutT (NUDIX family)
MQKDRFVLYMLSSAGIFYFYVMNFKEQIIKALAGDLPGEVSHKKMLPPNRELTCAEEEKKRVKNSSVLFLLFEENNELFVCLIKRPHHMKYHPGQVAMPGGRIEKGETAKETALRETWEEIGVEANSIEILGRLSALYVNVSRFLIHPFVGWLATKPIFKLNKYEVEKIVLFPLLKYKNAFCEKELETVSGKLRTPCISYENESIWGATAMILSEFYDILNVD